MPGSAYRSIQNPRQYRALRRQGYTKEAAARISNAQAPGTRVKAAGYGARAGEVIAGNLKRGADGKFTSAGAGSSSSAPSKPPARERNRDARRQRADAEADRRSQEDADEQRRRDEEDAKLDGVTDRRERNRQRQQIARDRRERRRQLNEQRRQRQQEERAARDAEAGAEDAERQQRREQPKPKEPKKGGGGGGKGGTDPAKDAERQQREQERQARRAEMEARRAEADARREAREQERQQREQERTERTQRELTDLSQRAATPGERLSDTQWQRLVVEGLAERQGGVLRLTDAGRQQAARSPEATKDAGAFTVFKDAAGEWRWIAISSTAFRDRDGEIVTTKALEEDCAHADATGEYGPLRWWHCPGVDIGDCDYNAVSGRSLIEMGTFRSPALAEAAALAAPDLELSIGFKHLPNEPGPDGAYTYIRRFERSLTPKGRASNLFTAFAVTKEYDMTPEKLKAALEKLGSSPEARALMQDIITQAQTREKAADEAGIAFKEAEATKAEMDPAEMIEAGATEMEDGEAEADDEGMLLTDAEITMIADRVAAALMGQLDGIAAKMAAVDEELKGRGYQKMKEATESLPAAIAALATTVKSIKATVDELAGLAPARGFRPTEDNPDLEALIESALKADGEAGDPSDPLASVMKFLRPAA